ncbi:MAG TPA: efflux RND transporter periplasmic adaptor subunit [Candidatus Dormibacteraeota bacterium]|nr:efflux RND transporter periplasmic adaptor subunit [Candidatus Dormibacteraeota bacterium]
MKTYRTGFLLALIGNILLAVVLVGLWLHYRAANPMGDAQTKQANSSAQDSMAASMTTPPASTEAPLVPVQIPPERLQRIGVKTGRVESKVVEDEIRVTGNVAVDETRLSMVQVRYSGYIQKVFADATYQYLRKGQPLFTIYSPDLVATEREYLVAKKNQQRVAQSTVPGVTEGASSLLEAATERLKQWGVSQREIERLESTGEVQKELEVESPVSGYITERNALPNLTVQPETRLYSVADLSTVWVLAEVFQNDLGRIKVGDRATLTVDSYPGRVFEGRVNFIYPQVDMMTRTARARLIFSNSGLRLSPGMFVNVTLKVSMGKQLVIPATGVLQSGTRQIVFVSRGDGYIEPREVQLGSRAGDDFIVLKGVKSGEEIVTSANFLIDSESQLQAALGSFVPPPPGAGAAGAINAPQAKAELTTEPDPPHKGANTIRVRLADASGGPISGAEVSITFSMPAMPAMGMAAMRTQVPLTDKGNGLYEGSGQLGSGGTWQVTIVAKKNGQIVASKQLSVNATEGM